MEHRSSYNGAKNEFQEETFDFHSAATESRCKSKIPKMDRLGLVLLVHRFLWVEREEDITAVAHRETRGRHAERESV